MQHPCSPAFSRPAVRRARAALGLAFAALAASGLHAANGTWIGAASPLNWDDAANWAGGAIADGADFTADFGATDINGYTVVQLTAPRTIGHLVFGDSALATPGSWNIGDNSVAANVLSLTGTAPTITVPDLGAGQNVSISANLAGSGGLTKAGAGALILYGGKSYTGDTHIDAGTLVTTNTIPGGTDAARTVLSIASGATLEFRAIYGDIAIRPSTITGAGTILKTGTGIATLAGDASSAAGSSSLTLDAGSVIDIREGTLRLGNWNSSANTLTGQAAVVVAAGATFNFDSTSPVIGSLSGAGTVSGGYYYIRPLTVGADNTSTTFSGAFVTNSTYSANSSPTLFKVGNGALTLTGSANIRSVSGQSVLSVAGGVAGSPSTLNLNFTAPSAIGYIITGENGGNANIAANSTDVVVVDHSAGSLAVSQFNLGDKGVATYTARGTAQIDAFTFQLGFTGPYPGDGAVVLNVADSAQVRIFSNRHLVMGQYYGRPVTVNQTGGFVGLYNGIATNSGVTLGGTGSLAFKSANTAATYNLAGGTLAIPAITRDAAGSGAGGGNGVVNFDGGTLQITADTFTVPDGEANGLPLVTVNVKEGGATIDPHGLGINFNVPLRHAGAAALDGGLTVAGSTGGTLTLSAANTYTGDTVVESGATLALPSSSQLVFKLGANGLGTRLRGAGAVSLDCPLVIDRSAADLTDNNTWQLVDVAALSETYGSNFALTSFTETAGVWTLVDGDYTWTFTEATGALVLDAPVSETPYESWAAGHGLAGADAAASADPDADGLVNQLEFALDGDPQTSDATLVHSAALSIDGTRYLTLTVAVRDGAVFSGTTAQVSGVTDGVTYTIEGSADLAAAWNSAVSEASGPEIAAYQATLPAATAGWTYRTFRFATPLSSAARAFLRAKVE